MSLSLEDCITIECERGKRDFDSLRHEQKEYMSAHVIEKSRKEDIEDFMINDDSLMEVLTDFSFILKKQFVSYEDYESLHNTLRNMVFRFTQKKIDFLMESEINNNPDKYYSAKELIHLKEITGQSYAKEL